MSVCSKDDEYCENLIKAFAIILPNLNIKGQAEEPFYKAPKANAKAVLYFRNNCNFQHKNKLSLIVKDCLDCFAINFFEITRPKILSPRNSNFS